MKDEKGFYRVISDLFHMRLPDPLEYGYESERDFRHALYRLAEHWNGRTGECVGERHGFLLLRFHDTPGGKPDEAWLPTCLLEPGDPAQGGPGGQDSSDSMADELDKAFGFD